MIHRCCLAIGVSLLVIAGCSPVERPDLRNQTPQPSPQTDRFAAPNEKLTRKPLVEITLPRPAWENISYVTPETIYRWRTAPDAVPPRYVRWILVDTDEHDGDFETTLEAIRNSENDPRWSSWHDYRPNRGEGTWWLTPVFDPGDYVFVVQGRGANGYVDDEFDIDRNVRYVHVQQGEMGPLVTMYGEYLDPFETVNPGPLAIVDVPQGATLTFCWTADAFNTGSEIATYRYGWDITDLMDDEQWEIEHTPWDGSMICSPPRSFQFGTHTFSVHVMDAGGRSTYAEVKTNILYQGNSGGVLDVRPGSCENVLNLKSGGMIDVVVAGNDDFDVTRIDVSSIQLEMTPPIRIRIADRVAITEPGGCVCTEPVPDGHPDLVLQFSVPDLAANLDGFGTDGRRTVKLWGEFEDRRSFVLIDCIRIVGMPVAGRDPLAASPAGRSPVHN